MYLKHLGLREPSVTTSTFPSFQVIRWSKALVPIRERLQTRTVLQKGLTQGRFSDQQSGILRKTCLCWQAARRCMRLPHRFRLGNKGRRAATRPTPLPSTNGSLRTPLVRGECRGPPRFRLLSPPYPVSARPRLRRRDAVPLALRVPGV